MLHVKVWDNERAEATSGGTSRSSQVGRGGGGCSMVDESVGDCCFAVVDLLCSSMHLYGGCCTSGIWQMIMSATVVTMVMSFCLQQS